MCTVFTSINSHPKFKLILLSNRDEFYKRKSLSAHWWQNDNSVLGGKDLKYNGMWLGISKEGKIGIITNYREHIDPSATQTSRGEIVKDYLFSDLNGLKFLNTLKSKVLDYNGFNLLVGNPDEMYYFSNRQNNVIKLKKGVYGLSNALLDTDWTKVRIGKLKFKQIIAKTDFQREELFNMMLSQEKASDNELPDTGFGYEKEKFLSSLFMQSEIYGTVSTNLILVDYNNNIYFEERVHYPVLEVNQFEFQV